MWGRERFRVWGPVKDLFRMRLRGVRGVGFVGDLRVESRLKNFVVFPGS